MTFPAANDKASKNTIKMSKLSSIEQKTLKSFPVMSGKKEIVTGIEFYKSSLHNDQKVRNRTQVRKGQRNGTVLLLSNYKPKDFGNAQIDLTVDGGQHLRSPGEDPPKISNKNIEQIFKDPIFDHKTQIRKLQSRNRRQLVHTVENSIRGIESKLVDPRNYK